jgi:hypothetical protein
MVYRALGGNLDQTRPIVRLAIALMLSRGVSVALTQCAPAGLPFLV